MTAAAVERLQTRATEGAPAHVVIATINRLHGSTGVHTHTAALHDGFNAAGVKCDVVTAFDGGPQWLALFAVRKVLDRVNPDAAVAWYRHWHGAALKASLRKHLLGWRLQPPPVAAEAATPVSEWSVVAQDPVSARAAMDVRESLGMTFPVTLVCHFNHSEAQEYRDLGQLDDPRAYADMLTFEADVLRSVDRVVYVSEWARSVVERDRHIIPRESVVIPNGISATVDAPPLSRLEIGASPDDFVLMNVGTLEARKNQLGLLELFAKVVRARPQSRLVLVGEGGDRSKIENRAGEFGIAGRVTLLGHRSDVASLLPLADLYVHYAAAENCPIVILEAARAGLPWAAPATAGVVELQQKVGGSIALNPDDLAGSSQRIVDMIDDRSLGRRLGETARSNFRSAFTRDAMVHAYAAALGVVA